LTAGKGIEPSAELIGLAGRLPADEAAGLLRSQWEHAGLRDAIVLALARHPQAADRSKFVEALGSPQPGVVARAAGALPWLGMDVTADELAAALAAFKQACALPRASEPRPALIRLLEYWTEGSADVDDDPDPTKSYLGWYAMYDEYYPHEAAKLKNRAGIDAGSLRKRLASVDWPAGEAPRGREVFERRACHRCHQVSGHLGPELKGAVARMSRDDLFTAIVDPNLEVSAAFQTTAVATNSGQVYHGVVVYESPESTLLQTGPDTTVRILNADTASLRKSKQSLMPTGLLETLSDRDLSDLYAYLRTLGAK
jgi:putative heme-binding domain-containing protein